MVTAKTLGIIAAWFLLGQARIVLASKLAEHRTDAPNLSTAFAFNLAAVAGAKGAHYDPRGRRLLPWYRAVNATYWVLVGGVGVWAIVHV